MNDGTGITVAQAIVSRRSIRAFTSQAVARETVTEILGLASFAPSGANMQPWQVIVVTGNALKTLGAELREKSLAGDRGEEEYPYYPKTWREPYQARRRKVGLDLYKACGIERGDRLGSAQQAARNFVFFDAPVGIFLTMDRDLGIGSWLDYGMFMQNIAIAARSFDLHTCMQAAFNAYHETIAERLQIPAERQLICSIALGYADASAPENIFEVEREPVSMFTRFVDELKS